MPTGLHASRLAVLLAGSLLATPCAQAPLPMAIPIVVVSYFPRDGDKIDIKVTGDWGEGYVATKAKCAAATLEAIAALEEGSRWHGYKTFAAAPSLDYQVVAEFAFDEALPTLPKQPDANAPMVDYAAIVERIGIAELVAKQGVKQVWIHAYHGGVVNMWESNMSSPTGDVSNSDRNEGDLPVLASTYTVYHYNYQRGVSEMIENHMHQLEAILNHADGRETTHVAKWHQLLFWGKFVGSDRTHKLVSEPKRCGWSHYAPNSESDYDWSNPRFVESDIEDWQPDGIGKLQKISCDRWAGDSLRWKVYWLQNIPGAEHGLSYQGKALRNWWTFVADWDAAKREKWRLTVE